MELCPECRLRIDWHRIPGESQPLLCRAYISTSACARAKDRQSAENSTRASAKIENRELPADYVRPEKVEQFLKNRKGATSAKTSNYSSPGGDEVQP